MLAVLAGQQAALAGPQAALTHLRSSNSSSRTLLGMGLTPVLQQQGRALECEDFPAASPCAATVSSGLSDQTWGSSGGKQSGSSPGRHRKLVLHLRTIGVAAGLGMPSVLSS